LLHNPATQDSIYQCLKRLLKDDALYHLGRSNKIRYRLRHLARKRFTLGYPPRKNTDNSIGDAVNWEWIIHCAITSKKNIIIVSRDSDYGIQFEDRRIINDWLKHEFKERVSQKRKIFLTDKLSEAFKKIGIKISKKEEDQENKIINMARPRTIQVVVPNNIRKRNMEDILGNITEVIGKYIEQKKMKN
jgi:hypothetical protein